MPISVLMPKLSPTMDAADLARWHKKEGDPVKPGELIAEIETDKTTMEVEATDAGRMGRILVPAGTPKVPINTVIGVILTKGEADLPAGWTPDGTTASSAVKEDAPPSVAFAGPAPESAKPLPPLAGQAGPAVAAGAASGERVFITPLAKRMAEQGGINPAQISGSGPHGRIVKSDVESALAQGGAGAPASAARAPVLPLGEAFTAVPHSAMRKVIARRLGESKQTVPHFYLTMSIRLDALLELRPKITAASGEKVSVNDAVIRAAALALAEVPAANAGWADEYVKQYRDADIAVAVATPGGLITPIIRAAQGKSLVQISREMKDLGLRARSGKLRPEEYQGGSFSISNLGMYGVEDFAAIINPPQACILAVGQGARVPVVNDDGSIAAATVMKCTLSVDHRVVDGAVGAQLLGAFRALIEEPLKLLV